MSGYKLVNRFTGTAYEGNTLVNRFRGTSYPVPDVFDSYEEAFRVVNHCRQTYRVVIVPASFHTPLFVLGKKVYPCPAKDEPIPKLTYYGSGSKRAMVQEHPCLFPVAEKVKKPEVTRYAPEILTAGYHPPRKMCHHALCARKAHRNGYECSCPAGDEPMPKRYGVAGVKRVAVREHPCQIHPGKRCHHVFCAWQAHSDDAYECHQGRRTDTLSST